MARRIERHVLILLATMALVAQGLAANNPQGLGDVHRADPCDHAPLTRGKAEGLQPCWPLGNSSGVARGDFNGDGVADLAIGVPFEDLGSIVDAGVVNVIYGSANGLSASAAVASQLWHRDQPGVQDIARANDRFGSALASGDFNGDGFSDLAILATGANAVHWLFGSPGGLVATNNQMLRGTNFVDQQNQGLIFLDSLAWGDFNGDGFGDLAIEASASIPQGVGRQGAVVHLYGTSQSFGLAFSAARPPIFFPNAASASTDSGGAIGSVNLTLAGGDFDADGRADLAVGVPFADHSPTLWDAGRVFILRGSANGLTTTGVTNLTQESAGQVSAAADAFGLSLAAGDFNGDGQVDLAVGVPLKNFGNVFDEGLVCVFTSASVFHSRWTQTVVGQLRHSGDNFGGALAAGDFNGDGFRDLAIGTPGDQLPQRDNAGSVTIVYGGPTGLASTNGPGLQFFTEDVIVTSGTSQANDRFGSTLTAWNFGRTAHADLAIGIPFKDILVSLGGGLTGIRTELRVDAGLVRVIYGSASGLSRTGAQAWSQNSSGVLDSVEAGDRFGAAVY